jgi:hypothetical protein
MGADRFGNPHAPNLSELLQKPQEARELLLGCGED